jgi:hemoglobin-like flavoprotein
VERATDHTTSCAEIHLKSDRLLEQSLGDDFTLAVRRAWTAAYGLLAWTMITAAEAELREAA